MTENTPPPGPSNQPTQVVPGMGGPSAPATPPTAEHPGAASAEPAEGWQAAYQKAHKRSTIFMITTIALAVTTVLAGMLALGLGAWAVSETGSGSSHSKMGDGRGGHRGGQFNGNEGFDGDGPGRLRATPGTTSAPTTPATPAVPSATATPTPTR